MATLGTPPTTATAATPVNFQRYYEEAGPDYAAWSPHFNMHFGFFRWGMNPFRREAMLEQMNQEILHRLHLNSEPSALTPPRILDMGCGGGRHPAQLRPAPSRSQPMRNHSRPLAA